MRRLILTVAGAFLLVAALLPAAAQAAGGSSTGIPFSYQGVKGVSVLPVTFTAGDCRQTGLNQTPNLAASLVQVEPPVNGRATVRWKGTLYTVSSRSGDVWHARFVFRDAFGQDVLTVRFDFGQMWPGTIYHSNSVAQVDLSQAQWDSITFSDWFGDC
ncbi:hypothetical protein MF672_033405 [Actinomadura sp. ATCC 31491]|uniref:Uncharacterized protein n=1 Tax=Actinomadura luzonensis TaxID=2805427 RepID=A0ABT0G2M0_9ACTN|nr:hypothetical protein [Actinomadura luzonensis]MCK2218658.1 hypothetical protein [Actinomadura luzonensis]